MLAKSKPMDNNIPKASLRTCIQKVATGPEYSKDLTFDEARQAMRDILDDEADHVQAAVFLIALRMKRETDEENCGVLQAIMDSMETTIAPVDEVLDIADPYDGHTRGLPAAPFLPPVLAACGVACVSHGLEYVGPKFGITHRKVLRAAGIDVDATLSTAVERIANKDVGWSYIDQKQYCPPLHNLVDLRTRIVKRPVITTVEVLTGPIRGRNKTHLLTGYVHKAYPPIYTALAKHAGFDSAIIVRGVEGGVIPSISQAAKVFYYHGQDEEQYYVVEPDKLGIQQSVRAVPLPDDLPEAAQINDDIATTINSDAAAEVAAKLGIEALEGKPGPMRDSLVYATAICLKHLGRYNSLQEAGKAASSSIDSGEALARLRGAAV